MITAFGKQIPGHKAATVKKSPKYILTNVILLLFAISLCTVVTASRQKKENNLIRIQAINFDFSSQLSDFEIICQLFKDIFSVTEHRIVAAAAAFLSLMFVFRLPCHSRRNQCTHIEAAEALRSIDT